MKIIINQDRNSITYQTEPLGIAEAKANGKIYGYNLYHRGKLLGTFDTDEDAFEEAVRIGYSGLVAFVSGYHEYNGSVGYLKREFMKRLEEDNGFAWTVAIIGIGLMVLIALL